MNKSALTVQCKASNRYNPYVLSRYLSKETDGTIIVNRASAVQTEDDERLFLVVLNYDYLWGYKNPEHVTVYFETDGETVIGGVYNMHTQERQSRRVIVTEMGKGNGVCNDNGQRIGLGRAKKEKNGEPGN